MTLLVRCPAKINPTLRVLRRRDDGFHELDLEFQSLELHDELWLERAPDFELVVEGADPGAVPVADNLVLRAARALRDEMGAERLPGARLRLRKRVPAAAGLGGGSSDAAGTLEGLLELWGLRAADLGAGRLEAIALTIGSDVPYFLVGGRQRGRGRGERLSPLPDGEPRPVVLLRPRVPLSTAAVFRAHAALGRARGALAGPGGDDPSSRPSLTNRKSVTTFQSGSREHEGEGPWDNDLWPAAVEALPSLAESVRHLRAAWPDATVGMSGSGPTLFARGEPGSVADARRAAERLEGAVGAGSDVLLTRTLDAAEYRSRRFDRAPRSNLPGR